MCNPLVELMSFELLVGSSSVLAYSSGYCYYCCVGCCCVGLVLVRVAAASAVGLLCVRGGSGDLLPECQREGVGLGVSVWGRVALVLRSWRGGGGGEGGAGSVFSAQWFQLSTVRARSGTVREEGVPVGCGWGVGGSGVVQYLVSMGCGPLGDMG